MLTTARKLQQLLSLIILLSATSSFGREEKILIMGYRTTEKLPSIEKAPSNKGYFKDLYEEAAKRIGYKLKIVRTSKLRILRDLQNGTIDFYPSFAFNQQRAKYAYWIDSGHLQRDVAITLQSVNELRSENDITGLTQLVALGNPDYVKGFDKSKFKQEYVAELSIERALKLLKRKRADFYIYEENALRYYLKSNRITEFKIHPKLLPASSYESAGFSRHSPLFQAEANESYDPTKPLAENNLPEKPGKNSPVARISLELKKMRNDGTTARLYKKHFD